MILNNPISLLLMFGCIMFTTGLDDILFHCENYCFSTITFQTLIAYTYTIVGLVIATCATLRIEKLVKKWR